MGAATIGSAAIGETFLVDHRSVIIGDAGGGYGCH